MKYCLFLVLFVLNTAFADSFSIEEATIDSVHSAIKSHTLTCEQLIKIYLSRIATYNLSVQKHPPINAFTAINSSVLAEARQLDNIFSKTHILTGPLHCIPVVVKDNIDTFDISSTTGSLSLLGNQPNHDAFLVAKLRDAGAIILGNGAMDEFAWGLFGMSSRSGRIGNAYNTTQNPGGSSGGPAAAVSANFAMIGIGTDNSGSVRIPAAFNGIVGLRPSTGLISQRGIFPMGKLDGVAGPLTRTVKDLAIVLDVIAKPDFKDYKTQSIPRIKSYKNFLNKNGLMGMRIGVVRRVGNFDTFKNMPLSIRNSINHSLHHMQRLGAIVRDDIQLSQFDNNREFNQAGEIQDVDAYLASFPATRQNFHDICESNRTRTFGSVKDCLKFMDKTPKKMSKAYQQTLKMFAKNQKYIARVMQSQHLDALYIPICTQGIANYDPYTINTWQAPVSSNSGLPSIVVNIGYENGMPIGIELVGKQFQEGQLIAMAYAYETHRPARKIPIMPEGNFLLKNYSIPELNNLFTLIGMKAYEKVLIHCLSGEEKVRQLSGGRFKKIVAEVMTPHS